jgi:hypothetical protein
MAAYKVVKLFDLVGAPDHVQEAIRPIAFAHVSTVDASAIWEVIVGSYDWRNAAEEWALHDWIRENGAINGETVLVRMEGSS